MNEVKDTSVKLDKTPFTTREVGVISEILKKFSGSNKSAQKAYDNAKEKLKTTTMHMDAYSALEEFYNMLPEDAQKNFAIPISGMEQTDEDADKIKQHIENDNVEEAVKILSNSFKKNRANIDTIKFSELKPFHEKLKTQVEVFESLRIIMNKCDAITDYHGDDWDGRLEDVFKNR